jgi:hypothetical protein
MAIHNKQLLIMIDLIDWLVFNFSIISGISWCVLIMSGSKLYMFYKRMKIETSLQPINNHHEKVALG